MKERNFRHVTGEVHPDATRIALITQCSCKTTYHPTVTNCVSRQFRPAAESKISILGETVIRVAILNHIGAPRYRLDGRTAVFAHNIHTARYACGCLPAESKKHLKPEMAEAEAASSATRCARGDVS